MPSRIMPKTSPKSPAGFEAAMDTLEQLVTRMEAGDLPLEESLREYQRGMELIHACQTALDEAQQRIARLVEDSDPPAPAAPGARGISADPKDADDDDVPF
jgi:exodeoxyribonuclease VII small subunit